MRDISSTRSRLLRMPVVVAIIMVLVGVPISSFMVAHAQSEPAEGFALQVSPSPLISTVKPGESTSLELRIRNTGNASQQLKMGMQSFTIDENTGEVKLQKDAPADVAKFVSFEQPAFTVAAGEIFTQKVIIDTPASAGFTYSFATTVSQQNPPKAEKGANNIRGTVAVFTLLNVDKPGATRKLELSQFSADKRMFEYLPADFTLSLKNSGNTLAQPKGTVYIQRASDDDKPLASLQINESGGFILPGTSRKLAVSWNDGLPHYQTITEGDQKGERTLSWSGGDPSKFRMGKYVAKIVAVYDDGERDVPLMAEVSFWVIPWRILLCVAAVFALIVIGVVTTLRRSSRAFGLKVSKSRKPGKHDEPTEK